MNYKEAPLCTKKGDHHKKTLTRHNTEINTLWEPVPSGCIYIISPARGRCGKKGCKDCKSQEVNCEMSLLGTVALESPEQG